MAEEQLDYGDEEFGGSQKMQYHADGAIPALAEDEIGGEDDEYDDLYNDVNVGEGFLQMQRSEPPPQPPPANVGNGTFHGQKVNVLETQPQPEPVVAQDVNIPGVPSGGSRVPDNKDGMTIDLLQKRTVLSNDVQGLSTGFRGPGNIQLPQNELVPEPEPAPMPNSNPGQGLGIVPQMVGNQMTRPMVNESQARAPVENNGATTLFVGELHWWTTDAELENVLSQYGRVKEIKFFDERASGKSKGYCQVEFYDSVSAAACKEGMNGYVFNGRACVVAFASPQTIRQMGASYANKNQGPAQPEPQGRRPMNDMAGRGGGTNFSGGDAGRNYGRGGNWGRGGQGVMNRGGGHMRGRGGAMGPKNNAPGFGGPGGGGYGPGFGGPPGGFMHPQGMMGGGFDPTYMGRGAGYGGFPGSGFPGMMPQFPGVNPMGLTGVAPHVNPAFFNRGIGMMGSSGMEGMQGGMWGDTGVGGWGSGGGEDHGGQRTRESSYGGEDGGSEYGYGDVSHEKAARSKERGSEREWSGNSEKRVHRDERDQDRDHRQKDRGSGGYDDDWDRGQSSTRSRSRSRAIPEEDHRSRSRDADYGKRRRMRSD